MNSSGGHPNKQNYWLISSSTSFHSTHDRSILNNYQESRQVASTYSASESAQILGSGEVELNVDDGTGKIYKLVLDDVKYVPNSYCNMFAVSPALSAGFSFDYSDNVTIKLPNGTQNLFGVPSKTDNAPYVVNVVGAN